jgi:hypothetical protein
VPVRFAVAVSGPSPRSRLRALIAASFALVALAIVPAAASASRGILYDQTTGARGGFVLSEEAVQSHRFDCDQPTYIGDLSQDCYAADDFTVPPGAPWYIQNVHVDGEGGIGDRFTWSALPGDVLPAEPATSLVASATGFVNRPPGAGSFDISGATFQGPNNGVALQPGHYWLQVKAGGLDPLKPERKAKPWGWQTQTPLTGYQAVWANPPCGGASWKYLSECGLPAGDLRFRIEGELVNREFSAFKLSKRFRRPAGGVVMAGTFPGPGELTLRKLAGKAKLEPCKCWVVDHGGHYLAGIKVKPVGATKAALKEGGKVAVKVAVTYTRAVSDTVAAPPNTQILNLVLKKP